MTPGFLIDRTSCQTRTYSVQQLKLAATAFRETSKLHRGLTKVTLRFNSILTPSVP